jgi:hypothetical protein
MADSGERGRGSALHVWCRLVLPSIVLAPVDVAEGRAEKSKKARGGKAESVCQIEAASLLPATAFARALLACGVRGAARFGVPAGRAGAAVPVVPASAVAAADAAASGTAARPVARAASLQAAALRGALADMRAECGTTDAVRDAVAAALDAAAAGDAAGGAAAAVEQLVRHGEGAARAWAKAHRAALAPSTAVLEHLVRSRAALAPLLGAPGGAATLAVLLAGLSKAHAPLLRGGGTAARTAQRAQAAVESLQVASVSATGSSVVVSLAVLVLLSAGAVAYAARNSPHAKSVLEPYVGASIARTLVGACESVATAIAQTFESLWDSFTLQR